ncbi:hypothetical protein LEP1GSC047_2918 [Leptospira inadai serovar Lyme str. 10]|uniref:Uncharacterized protein n=1 Tax=Leptospira inadai serovar Lyme str. 10 TaxID=1049790 RepID=V6HIJ3_9LEPT|nr:hypothetical protein LEP1GSC047_2918 [Leptospira inadai serovar Lyme str. 10]
MFFDSSILFLFLLVLLLLVKIVKLDITPKIDTFLLSRC